MTVLAIDTSARGRSMAVLATPEGELIDHRSPSGLTSAGALIEWVADLLSSNDVVPVAVVVAVGPGSYTGVRAGMAAALGIAQASFIPLHGVGSLEVVAHAAPLSLASGVAASLAGRDALYTADFERRGAHLHIGDASRLTAADWAARPTGPDATAVSFDGELVAGDVRVAPPHVALAAAVATALTRRPLPLAGLSADHVVSPASAW